MTGDCSHLVENVIVLLRGKRPDHPALVEAVAVEPGPVEGAVTDLDLNEVTLKCEMRSGMGR